MTEKNDERALNLVRYKDEFADAVIYPQMINITHVYGHYGAG